VINLSNRFSQVTIKNNSTSSQATSASSSDEQIMSMVAPKRVDPLLWNLSNAQERRALLEHTSQEAPGESNTSTDTASSGMEGNSTSTAFLSQQDKTRILDYAKYNQPELQGEQVGSEALTQKTGDTAISLTQSSEQQSLNEVTQQFQDHFSSKAQDKSTFHEIMQKTFGDQYDVGKAETIRQQTLQGDFSWMPDVQVVDGRELQDLSGTQSAGSALGAYSAENDTVYLSRELLASSQANAEKILTEEVGHAIDNRVNVQDAKGDEGDIFSRFVHGENVSAETLNELKQENDSGVIEIDGKKIEVEYGWLSDAWDSAKDRVSNAWDSAKDKVSNAWNNIKEKASDAWDSAKEKVSKAWSNIKEKASDAWKSVKEKASKAWSSIKEKAGELWDKVKEKVINNKWVRGILSIAQFIPGVNAIAIPINAALAIYDAAQGIKNGSIAGVLGGIAGLAGGAASLGKVFGASSGFVNGLTNFSSNVGKAAAAYSAIKDKNFAAMASYASNIFGSNSGVANAINHAGTAHQIYESAKSGNYLGAIGAGTSLMQEFTGPEGDSVLQTIGENAETMQTVKNAVESGNYSAAVATLTEQYGSSVFNLDKAESNKVNQVVNVFQNMHEANQLIKDHNYADAAQLLLKTAQDHASSPESRQQLMSASQTVQQIDNAIGAVKQGEYTDGIASIGELLNTPLDDHTRQVLTELQAYAEDADKLMEAIKSALPDVIEALKQKLEEQPVVIRNLLDQVA
jgi:vacuolar-type H+-ATPase subunit H